MCIKNTAARSGRQSIPDSRGKVKRKKRNILFSGLVLTLYLVEARSRRSGGQIAADLLPAAGGRRAKRIGMYRPACYTIGKRIRNQMLMCHKVTHKNLLDSRPLFRSMIQILRVILHFTICFRRIARFFSKAFSEMAHLAKTNAGRNIANRFSCSFQKLRCH
mgnify:CR=1 FL=1